MPLILQADKPEELPEALRASAKNVGGKLTVDALPEGWAIEDVGGLRKTVSEERAARKALEKAVKAFEGIDDPAAARDALEKVASGAVKSSKELDEAKKALEAKFANDRKAIEEATAKLQTQLQEVLVDRDATAAIAAAGGNLKLLLPIVKSAAKVERDASGKLVVQLQDESGKPLVTKKSGSADPMGFGEFVEGLKATADYRGAFAATGAGGAGTTSQHGGTARAGTNASNGANLSPEESLARYYERMAGQRQ